MRIAKKLLPLALAVCLIAGEFPVHAEASEVDNDATVIEETTEETVEEDAADKCMPDNKECPSVVAPWYYRIEYYVDGQLYSTVNPVLVAGQTKALEVSADKIPEGMKFVKWEADINNYSVDAGAEIYLRDLTKYLWPIGDSTFFKNRCWVVRLHAVFEEAEKPVDPDPEKPVDPDPEKPVDPDPSKPVDPDPEKPVDPDPSKPVDPDTGKTGVPSLKVTTSNPKVVPATVKAAPASVKPAPKTGDTSNMGIWLVLAAAAVVAVTVIMKKRKSAR